MAAVTISKHMLSSRSQYFMSHPRDTCMSNTRLTLFWLPTAIFALQVLTLSLETSLKERIGLSILQETASPQNLPLPPPLALIHICWLLSSPKTYRLFLFKVTWSGIQVKADSMNYFIDNKDEARRAYVALFRDDQVFQEVLVICVFLYW